MEDRPGWMRPAAVAIWLCVIILVGCWTSGPADYPAGDPDRGAELFLSLPCAGCHGATALGQFGPPLAGTTLTFEEVRQQVREPRDRMVPFSPETVSDVALRDIYAWLQSLPRPAQTDSAPAAGPTATALARNRLFPEMDATTLLARTDQLDEVALRIMGKVESVVDDGRYTQIRIQMDDGRTAVVVVAIYDTARARGPFPAAVGDQLTLYGVGADPVEGSDVDGEGSGRLPRMQVIYVEPAQDAS